MTGNLYFWFTLTVITITLLIIRLYTRPKFSENFEINNTQYKIINISDYENNWNNLADLVMEYSKKYDNIIVNSDFDNIIIIANALTFMIENLKKPVIVTNNSENTYKIIKNNKLLPLNVMVEHNNKLYTGVSSYKDGENILGIPISNNRTTNNEPTSIKYVNPNININVIDSKPNLDIVNSCSGDAIILNVNDLSHLNNNSIQYLIDNPLPSVIINNTNGNITFPSFKMTSAAAYAKLAVIMSNIDDIELTEPVFAKNLKDEFI